jgi:sterol desaturase/sphingolipid hydroxylase (fatty acid hydroxylase superfamily)
MDWSFFISTTTLYYLMFTMLVFTLALLAEMLWPRRAPSASLSRRWLNNVSLALITWYVSQFLGIWFSLALARWTDLNEYGLLHQIELGFWLSLLIVIVVLQFLSYWTHVAFHRVPWLWPLHAIHHSDVDVDATTSYRHHPLEPLVFLPLLAVATLLLGIPLTVALGYQAFRIIFTVFSHSCVRIPELWENRIRRFVVTPDYHRIHHASDPEFTNSNYGSLVPWFDYLFGSARHRDFSEHESFQLGLGTGRSPRSNRIDQLVLGLGKFLPGRG